MKTRDAATWSALTAHALSWAAFLWLMLWPYSYRGASAIPALPGGPPGQSTEIHASLIAMNGLRVIPILLVPVVLTALLLAVALSKRSESMKAPVAGFLVTLLLVFCALGAFSIGLLYLPAALAAGLAAVLLLRRHRASPVS